MKNLIKGVLLTTLTPLTFSILCASPAQAWWGEGHSMIASNAVELLPEETPAWFRQGKAQIAHCAQDPDVQKSRDLPIMTDEEYPQHFIDIELLAGNPLPKNRNDFYRLCSTLRVSPSKVGELPYSIAEWTQRLTMTFAEARQYPENKEIQTKALVYAGLLSHYSGDAAMPLHTTIHHDGRANTDGSSPKSGIHARIDSLIEKVKPQRVAASPISPFDNLLAGIEGEIKSSHTQIDRAYALEPQLPKESDMPPLWKPSPEVAAFTNERMEAGSRFTARLFLTAWRDSAKIKLPKWLNR
jgi:hypothetical protein